MSEPPRKPLATRVKASAVLLLIEAVLLAALGFFVVVVPGPQWRPWDAEAGARLPARESLSLAEGRVVELAYHTSRRRQYVRPKVEFSVGGRAYQVGTLASYSPSLLPFRVNEQPARVLYTPGRPQDAWLEWEYASFMAAKDGTPARMAALVETARACYGRLALAFLGLSALLLAVNLFVPVFRPALWLPWRRRQGIACSFNDLEGRCGSPPGTSTR